MRVTVTINDKTYNYANSPSKLKISSSTRGLSEDGGVFKGSGAVHYSGQYKHEFTFDSYEDMHSRLMPCLDDDLVKSFSRKG